MNICTFMGRLGADPEHRQFQNGDGVSKLRIAVSKKVKEKEVTTWVTAYAYSPFDQIAQKYLRKGNRVAIAAEYAQREYEKDGVTQYSHEFRVARLEIIDWPEKTEVGPPVTQAPAPSATPAPKPAAAKAPFEDDGELPF
jgi:single-strand DNA-binding protein